MTNVKIRIWSDDEDATEVVVAKHYSLEEQVKQYVLRNYEPGWSDQVTVFAQGPNESKACKFSVSIENVLHVTVRGSND